MNRTPEGDFDDLIDADPQEKVSMRKLWERLGRPGSFFLWLRREQIHLDQEDSGPCPRAKGEVEIDYWVTAEAALHIAIATDSPEGKRLRDKLLAAEKEVFGDEPTVLLIPELPFINSRFFQAVASRMKELEREIERLNTEISSLRAPFKVVKRNPPVPPV